MANISHFTQTVNGISTTYDIHDANAIPKTGSNQISGDLVPTTDNNIDIGSSTNNIKMLYTKGITIDGKTIDTDANDNMTFNGHIVDTIEEQGGGYIRYSNGIQICWGGEINNNSITTGKSGYTFPKAFNEFPKIIVTPDSLDLYSLSATTSATTFSVGFCQHYTSPSGYTPNPVLFQYIAIGTWK